MRLFRGLSGTFIIAFALTSALPLLLVAFFAIRNFDRSIEQEHLDRLQGIATLKTEHVQALIETKREALEALGRLPFVQSDVDALAREHAEGHDNSPAHQARHDRIRDLLELAVASDPSLNEVSFVDASHTIHISSAHEREKTEIAGEAWFIGAREQAYIGPLERAPDGNPELTIALPMPGDARMPRGMLFGRVRLSGAATILRDRAGLGTRGETYLVGPTGEILSVPPRNNTNNEMRNPKEAAMRCFENGPALQSSDGSVLRAFQRLSVGNACLIAEMPESEAFRSLVLFRTFMAVITLFALGIAIFFGLGIARSIIREISRLKAAARAVSAGDLATSIESGNVDEISGLAREFDAMRKNLSRANEREKLLSTMKSEFIFIAAHQLRTPLSGVKWALKTVLAGDVGRITKLQRRYVERAYDSNERMIRLVADLLDVSRLEEGKFGYEFASGDFRSFVQAIAEEYRVRFEEKKIAFEVHLPGTRMPASFDPDRLSLALRNLIENALHYTEAGGRVALRITESPDAITVEVADTGIGIPENQQKKLFTKFFRAENVIRMQTEGTGLGLFIAQNVVTAHGGTISIASEEGKGTTVSFHIPRKRAPDATPNAPFGRQNAE